MLCLTDLELHQSPAACDLAAAAEGGGMDLLLLLVAESKLAAASVLISASQLFLRVPANQK